RPDEAARLQFRDVTIVEDDATGETILEIEVRGKRGVGYCKSTSGAVRPFERLQDRKRPPSLAYQKAEVRGTIEIDPAHVLAVPEPTDLIFPIPHHELFNDILREKNLKFDREIDGPPIACVTPLFAYGSWKAMISDRSTRIVAPELR